MRSAWCGELCSADAGRTVSVCGWVARRRQHGEHLAFVDLRDRTGIVQCVVDGASDLRSEYVLRVSGVVRQRPEGTVNPGLATGEVEVGDCTVEVLADAEPPPFPVTDRVDADEATRLRFRYVDLRRDRMQSNLALRARVNSALRAAMDRQGFTEVETPLLWTPTPEGAREFTVPSRLHRGSFYVLPQSPQIAKQLLMVAGVDRYYQIARCMRDEDLRADRQFEFTQLDVEASFVSAGEVMAFVSEAVLDAAVVATGERPPPIESITWAAALDRFGTDKPDLRFGMELVELTGALAGSAFKAFHAPAVKALRVPGSGGMGRASLDRLIDRAKELGAKGLVWLRVVAAPGTAGAATAGGAGTQVGALGLESPVAKFLSEADRDAICSATGAEAGDLVLVVADEHRLACEVLGQLRVELGRPPVGEGPHRYVWVTDFPLFEGLDEAGRPIAAHHPFTMPNPDDLGLLATDPLAVRSQSYDLVLNGWELGSGSIRIHRADVQAQVFDALGIEESEAEARFGFLLGALRYGAPPHGGFAVGVDRLVAVLAGEENIREVIAFPKTQSGSDPMTGAPKPLPPRVLRELGLSGPRAGARIGDGPAGPRGGGGGGPAGAGPAGAGPAGAGAAGAGPAGAGAAGAGAAGAGAAGAG
ncbi:MAG: aspartate--tRNA ligase, partial [Acidimicrobiales bacterium]